MKDFANVPLDVVAVWLLILATVVLFLLWVGKDKVQFFASLNTLNAQSWAFLILVIGVISAVMFNRAGIAVDIAAGIIGAGINMFTSSNKGTLPPGTSSTHLEVETTPPVDPIRPETPAQPK